MKSSRLALSVLAFVVAGTWAAQSFACDKDKAASASASASCSAEMAAKCTPEMMAACKAMGATAAADHCAGKKGASAVTASMKSANSSSCSAKASATTASARGAKKAGAMTASADHCAGKSATTTATTASNKVTAVVASAGDQCSGHGSSTAVRSKASACDACDDMAACDGELESASARMQVVPLKNGVMYVYTAESAGKVSTVQTAMARRTERMQQLVSAGDRARLCAECKTMRGAMASGKMHREVVNIEGGALTLVTSNDPMTIKKLHGMVDAGKVAIRTKS